MNLDPGLTALRPLGGFFLLRTAAVPPRPLPTLARAYADPAGDPSRHRPAGDPSRHRPADDPSRPRTSGDLSPDVHRDPLAARVRRVADALRTPELRVAASVAHQGLAARLWSVALGCAALYGSLPDLDPALLRWDPAAGAPDDLWLTEVRPLPADPATLAATVLDAHLDPLATALRARHRLAPGLLWGNAASALVGAARRLHHWAGETGRAQAGERTRALIAQLLRHPRLRGTLTGVPDTGTPDDTETPNGTETPDPDLPDTGTPNDTETSALGLPDTALLAPGTTLRRRSCCLYYRVPGGGVCGDCCFPRPPRSSPRAPSG
ncbi:(2Fe-2S)-binding protein [Streptomyces echinoruber]|uniref:(2Fe-2S)-binding protein n=1 Tax=Streptomyces echinoruber TaxID=68898 RepID=UPI00167C944D|nr:(2Fe-2S)-binding protein [Streptomyces echinoruber]